MKTQFNMRKISLILLIVMVGSFLIAGITFRITGGLSQFINGNGIVQEIDEVKFFNIEEINNINIDVTSTDVEFIPTDEPKLKVHFHGEASTESLKSRFELDANENNNVININVISKSFKSISFGIAHVNVKLDIYIPKNYDKNIFIDSTSSDVKINNLSLNTLTNETTSGNLIIDKVNTIDTKIKTTSGDILVSDFNGDLDIKSTSGDINIKYKNFNNKIDIDSVSGNTEIILDKESKFYLKAKTTSGDISCDFPITIKDNKKNLLEGNVGSSDNNINIKTTSGDIDIIY